MKDLNNSLDNNNLYTLRDFVGYDRTLSLIGTDIAALNIKKFSSFLANYPDFNTLETGYIGDDFIIRMKISQFLNTNSRITYLDLTGAEIGDFGLICLSVGLKNNPNIQKLGLSQNKITYTGFSSLVKILEGSNINYLDFSDNEITTKSIELLAPLLGADSSISSLYIRNNPINFKGIKLLLQCCTHNKSLTEVDISHDSYDYNEKLIKYYATLTNLMIKVIKENNTLTSLIVMPYNHYYSASNENLFQSMKNNFYITKLFNGKNKIDPIKQQLDKLLNLNVINVNSIEKVIKKAIKGVSFKEKILSGEENEFLTATHKNFVKAQLNAHPEWLEIEGRESIKVKEFLHEIEQYTIGLQLIGENSV
jgi:hypothetical protein